VLVVTSVSVSGQEVKVMVASYRLQLVQQRRVVVVVMSNCVLALA
jgi:hypothetical protein